MLLVAITSGSWLHEYGSVLKTGYGGPIWGMCTCENNSYRISSINNPDLHNYLESKGPSHLGTNHEFYVCASSKWQSQTCTWIGKVASCMWMVVHPVCCNQELHPKCTVCFKHKTTKDHGMHFVHCNL